MPQLKGLDFEIASRRYEIARRDGKMILNVKLLVRELTPYGGQEGSSRDRKELPFPRANELPSFPRGRILHRARLDGRRPGGRKDGEPRRKAGSFAIVFARTSRAYFISRLRVLYPFYLFFHVFVSCAAFAV